MLFRDLSLQSVCRRRGASGDLESRERSRCRTTTARWRFIRVRAAARIGGAQITSIVTAACHARFAGIACEKATIETAGLRASPVVCLREEGACITAAVPEFWQQFPKSIGVERSAAAHRIVPAEWRDQFELQAGEQKTHTAWLNFAAETSSARQPRPSIGCIAARRPRGAGVVRQLRVFAPAGPQRIRRNIASIHCCTCNSWSRSLVSAAGTDRRIWMAKLRRDVLRSRVGQPCGQSGHFALQQSVRLG